MESKLNRDLTRTVLAVLVIAGLIAASTWILRPFLAATIWATMIVVTTWPILRALQSRLWGKRWLATATMTVALLLVFIVPLSAAIGSIVANASDIVEWTSRLSSVSLPTPPAFVEKIPLVGQKVASTWREYAAKEPEELAEVVRPYAAQVAQWFVAEVGSFGLVTLQFLLTVLISAILYSSGEEMARWVRRFGRRLAGDRGDQVVRLAGQAIRGVALGVIVTAVVQSVLGGIALAITGVPYASVLTAVMLMLCLAQIGPLPVLLAGLGWLWWQDSTVWFVVLLICTAVVGTLDNILRPVLIKRGADLPLLLIFSGVIGGLFAFGLLGLFVGPVLLAVAYTLLDTWVSEEPDPDIPAVEASPRAAKSAASNAAKRG
jgi:predicted PurR-regulated permease PerM